MNAILLALALASSTPQTTQTTSQPTIEQEALGRVDSCVQIISGKADAKAIVIKHNIQSMQQLRDFVVGCELLEIGAEMGSHSGGTNGR